MTYLRNARKRTAITAKRRQKNDRAFEGHFYRVGVYGRHPVRGHPDLRDGDRDRPLFCGAQMIEAVCVGVFLTLGSLALIMLWEIWR